MGKSQKNRKRKDRQSNSDRGAGTRPDPARPAKGVLPGRTLHLIDVENLVGEDRTRAEFFLQAAEAYVGAGRVHDGDHLVVGSDASLAFVVREAFPHARLVTGRGENGADNALIRAVDVQFAESHYDRVVVASGDHVFADLVRHLVRDGVLVHVVACIDGLSNELRRAARVVIPFIRPWDVRRTGDDGAEGSSVPSTTPPDAPSTSSALEPVEA